MPVYRPGFVPKLKSDANTDRDKMLQLGHDSICEILTFGGNLDSFSSYRDEIRLEFQALCKRSPEKITKQMTRSGIIELHLNYMAQAQFLSKQCNKKNEAIALLKGQQAILQDCAPSAIISALLELSKSTELQMG